MSSAIESVSSTTEVSRRTLQRRARAAGRPRFAWTAARDAQMQAGWLREQPQALCAAIGCSSRALYKRAAELNLPPRDAVRRALGHGIAPRAPLRLPGYDELLRTLSGVAPRGDAARGLPGAGDGSAGRPRLFVDQGTEARP